ncbi:acylphosphatase [Kitasatospora griseola]|uniref:acylphosphatase n=1 Tax=Kitasatospora griseola TaxID=2064 RepID=UPI001E653E5B|nr:acylphosphatase [Kitasatospora griseola]
MAVELRLIEVYGTVQGVGFRPFAHRPACSLGLTGRVRNEDGRVVSLVAGPAGALAEYAAGLEHDAPPLARVTRVRSRPAPPGEQADGSGPADRRARSETSPPSERWADRTGRRPATCHTGCCASTSGRPRESARPTTCSPKGSIAPRRAPTWWSR